MNILFNLTHWKAFLNSLYLIISIYEVSYIKFDIIFANIVSVSGNSSCVY